MIKNILLDVGGTIFIKDEHDMGVINPAIVHLVENITPEIPIIVISDMAEFNVPKILDQLFPALKPIAIYYRGEYEWIDKTKPQTYTRVCELMNIIPTESILIDNDESFRSAAMLAGITTYDTDMISIQKVLSIIDTSRN